ncbi:hypothetical protein [Gordonia terrae]|uniref:hypothetical protein n=1 Tax=Gordonia terrae TaxID=2055 RepID=UPI003F6BC1FF
MPDTSRYVGGIQDADVLVVLNETNERDDERDNGVLSMPYERPRGVVDEVLADDGVQKFDPFEDRRSPRVGVGGVIL